MADNPDIPPIQGDQNVVSINQMGGQTAHTIYNIGPQPRSLNGINLAPMRQILAANRGAVMFSVPMGDSEAYNFFIDVRDFLSSAGWQIVIDQPTKIMGAVVKGIVIEFDGEDPGTSLRALENCLNQLAPPVALSRGGVPGNPPNIHIGMKP